MSSFFDYDSAGDAGPDDDVRLIARALIGVALECSTLGTEIAEAGGAISERNVAASANTRAIELLAFDRLAQNAQAQASLIAYLARHLLTGVPCSGAEVLEVIEQVPLADVRRRLRLAMGVSVLVDVPDDGPDDGAVLWIEEREPGNEPN